MAVLSTSLLFLHTQCKPSVGVILHTQALNDMSHNKRCLPEDWREVTGSNLRPQKCILTAVYASYRYPKRCIR